MIDAMGTILKALRSSAEKHNDQRRKDARSSPYINHPIQVVETLWSVGGVRDEALLTAAVLHDTIEDTDATPAEIEHEFGEDVLRLVLEVTDDKNLPKEIRKQLLHPVALQHPNRSDGVPHRHEKRVQRGRRTLPH